MTVFCGVVLWWFWVCWVGVLLVVLVVFGLVWVCYGVGYMFRLGGLVGLLVWFCVVFCEFGWLLRCGCRLCLGCLGSAFGLQFVTRFCVVCGFLVVSGFGCLSGCWSSGFRVFWGAPVVVSGFEWFLVVLDVCGV